MLTEKQSCDWSKRLIVFEHLCKENNIEVTEFMKEDFIRIMEEMREYDNKIHTNPELEYTWRETKKKCFDLTNIFLASKEYLELKNTYPYLKLSCLDYSDNLINKVEPKEGSFKGVLPNDFLQSLKLKNIHILRVVIPLMYSFINYSIVTQIENYETKSIIINLYDFIRYLFKGNE